MKLLVARLPFCFRSFLFLAGERLKAQPPADSTALPTWRDEIAQGLMPYHQLTVDDFPVNDRVHPGVGYWIKTFVDPRFHFYLKPYNGFVQATLAIGLFTPASTSVSPHGRAHITK